MSYKNNYKARYKLSMLIGVLCGLNYVNCGAAELRNGVNKEADPSTAGKPLCGYDDRDKSICLLELRIKAALSRDLKKCTMTCALINALPNKLLVSSFRYYWQQICTDSNSELADQEKLSRILDNKAHRKLLICVVYMLRIDNGDKMEDIMLQPLINSFRDLYLVYDDVADVFNKILLDFVGKKSDTNSQSKKLVIAILEIFGQIYALPKGELSAKESVVLEKISLLKGIESQTGRTDVKAKIMAAIEEIMHMNHQADSLRMLEVQHEKKMALLTQTTALLKESAGVARGLAATDPGLASDSISEADLTSKPDETSQRHLEVVPAMMNLEYKEKMGRLKQQKALLEERIRQTGLAAKEKKLKSEAQSLSAPQSKPKTRALHAIIYYGLRILLSILVIFVIINIINIWMPMPSILRVILFT